ncbi:MAG TPA: hydroxyacylglutathione hydrolase [Burkholderiaceae bacterium]|nr:hydroxyacylglutathione hydrolase [Burkholderiaceae bacterium]
MDPVPAFQDNYIWLLAAGSRAVVVDPGDAAPVLAALDRRGLALDAILITHHHPDHVGGVEALVAASGASRVRVIGPARENIPCITERVAGGERVTLLGHDFDVIDVPGHTLGHVAYYGAALEAVFCGDTLFCGGCGRLFEGTPQQMFDSLARLAALPGSTRVYCAHEYTLSNLRFAQRVEPDSAALTARLEACVAARGRSEPTVPSTIDAERATNPFLRCREPAVRSAAASRTPGADADAVATFAALRAWKNVA